MNLNVTSKPNSVCTVFHLHGKILTESDADKLNDAVSNLATYKIIFSLKELTHNFFTERINTYQFHRYRCIYKNNDQVQD